MRFDAVLKCYAPNNGPVVAQIFLQEDGSVCVAGEVSIARQRLAQLMRGAAGLPAPEKLPTEFGNSILPRRARRRKFHEAEYVSPPLV